MRRFKIGSRILSENAPELRMLLQHAYEERLRPLCMCKEVPVPMYIARLEDHYLIKRMPLSGRDHDPACPSYQSPYELSGLGPLIGNAIQIDAAGRAELRLDFPLTKRGPRSSPGRVEPSQPSIHGEARKLSLRAMLHYLWEAGELTEWRSTWAGKRGWSRVRNSLLNAASQMTVKGSPLSDMLFVPEVFRHHDRHGISARRATALKGIQTAGSGPRKLMLIVAEVKEVAAARQTHKVVARHLPFPLMVECAWPRLALRYEAELELWRSNHTFHLIAIATFGISRAGIASVEEIALMVVNEHWLPFENVDELRLLEKLSVLKRKSVKGLRFNLPRDKPVVSVTLPEQKPVPVAMFIVPAAAGNDYERALAEMIEARPEMKPWVWRVADGEMPRLP
ncbi:DUF1173 domain-containing protein [Pseudaminobacter sp. NGMCC 1.201702]|uniref:DUF1173 domain-containing protein n=1 Tax=Pseudaminobacter sp. NGMCC 1.201702 TaxID=3391825 RepID=UPI0039EDF22E